MMNHEQKAARGLLRAPLEETTSRVERRIAALEQALEVAREALQDVCNCGIEYTTRKYLVVQVDHDVLNAARAALKQIEEAGTPPAA